MCIYCDSLCVLATLQQIRLVELGRLRYTVDLCEELVYLVLDRLTVRECVCAVGSLHCQLVHSL